MRTQNGPVSIELAGRAWEGGGRTARDGGPGAGRTVELGSGPAKVTVAATNGPVSIDAR